MRTPMNKLLIGLLLITTCAFGETDYVARDLVKQLARRVESLETNNSVSVFNGATWSTVPGWRSLELVPSGAVSILPSQPGLGRARLLIGVTNSGGGGSGSGFPLKSNGNLASYGLTNGSLLQAVTGRFDSIILGGVAKTEWWDLTSYAPTVDLAEAVTAVPPGFPLTTNGDMNGKSLTNGATVRATNGVFQNTTAGALGATSAALGPTTVTGDLTVYGTRYENEIVITQTREDVYLGTNYITTDHYQTNMVYENTVVTTGTTVVITNDIETYVNVGGNFTMSSGSTFRASVAQDVYLPGLHSSTNGGTNTTATGQWDFTLASVLGLPSQGATNVGTGLVGDGLDTALSVSNYAEIVSGAANGTTAYGWGDHSTNSYLVENDTNYLGTGIAWSGGKLVTTGEGVVTSLSPNLVVTDASNAWSAAQSLPAGTTIGGVSPVVASEVLPLIYPYATNIILLASTNPIAQLLFTNATLPGPVTINPPVKISPTNAYAIWLTVPPIGTNTVTWSSDFALPVPVLSTNTYTQLGITCAPYQTNNTARRKW